MEIFIAASLLGLGFITGLSGAVLPGPFLLFVLSDSMRKGALSGPLTVLGHISVESPTIIALLFLGLRFEHYFTEFKALIYLIGGITLLVMALHIMREALRPSMQKTNVSYRYEGSILGGFLFTAFNPSFIPWWITIGWATLIAGMESPIWNGVLFVVTGHFLSDFAWYSFVSLSFSRGKRFLYGWRYEVMMLSLGILMSAIGLAFIIIGFLALPCTNCSTIS